MIIKWSHSQNHLKSALCFLIRQMWLSWAAQNNAIFRQLLRLRSLYKYVNIKWQRESSFCWLLGTLRIELTSRTKLMVSKVVALKRLRIIFNTQIFNRKPNLISRYIIFFGKSDLCQNFYLSIQILVLYCLHSLQIGLP